MVDLIAGITAVQTAMECGKGVLAGLKAIKETDKKLMLLGFTEKLVEQQKCLVEAKDEINSLLGEIQKLRHQLQVRDELQFDNDAKVYWRIKHDQREGPFCAMCFGDDDKVIPLNPNDVDSWYCPKCKNHFQTQKNLFDRRQEIKNLQKRSPYT